jgi:hypothetical protein
VAYRVTHRREHSGVERPPVTVEVTENAAHVSCPPFQRPVAGSKT